MRTSALVLALVLGPVPACHWILPLGPARDSKAIDPDGDGPDGRLDSELAGLDGAHACRPWRLQSCRELRAACAHAPSGIYPIDLGGRGVLPVYCDMDLDGGGWLLVGRTVDGPFEAFGWSTTAGAVDDDTRAYSLDVVGRALRFEQILLGACKSNKSWGENVYAFRVPQDFATAYTDRACDLTGEVTVIKGDCTPDVTAGGIWMFQYGGFTTRDLGFFFRDHPDYEGWGIASWGFNTAADRGMNRCDRNGLLKDEQGMIFVR